MVDIHGAKQPSNETDAQSSLIADTAKLPSFREHIVTNWQRFSSGLWRVPEGDISGAYCADKFPRLKTFVDCGQIYTNLGIAHLGDSVEAICYPLLPVGFMSVPQKPYSSEGEIGMFKSKQWLLGPKVIFVSEDPPVDECRKILRAKYADGGMFASQPSYAEFLESLEGGKHTANEIIAIERERLSDLLKLSKREMFHHLASLAKPLSKTSDQLSLF